MVSKEVYQWRRRRTRRRTRTRRSPRRSRRSSRSTCTEGHPWRTPGGPRRWRRFLGECVSMAGEQFCGDLRGARFRGADLRASRFSEVDLSGAVMRAVEGADLEIDAPWLHETGRPLLVNGVDVVPLVEAVLAERFPGRALRLATSRRLCVAVSMPSLTRGTPPSTGRRHCRPGRSMCTWQGSGASVSRFGT